MIPIGGIILWSGAIVDVPDRFQLCDGTNGTPNLRNRFVVGAGSTYAVNATGGSADPVGDVNLGGPAGDTGVAVSSGLKIILDYPLPPYLALAYIQRLS